MYEKIEQAHYKGEIAVTFIKLESKHEWRGGGGRSFSSPDSKTPNTLVLVAQNASNDLTRLDDMKINFTTLKHVGPIADPRTGQPCAPGSTPPSTFSCARSPSFRPPQHLLELHPRGANAVPMGMLGLHSYATIRNCGACIVV
ncbi:hypothetical protein BD779DRAFT_1571231 [Infundibulicybe gibba]|nr:hypothetical protein BD779DRAFT_1571231 [Infundibulicybe gibba]